MTGRVIFKMEKIPSLQFIHPQTFQFVGASKSGKTTLICRLIATRFQSFKNPPKSCVLYFNGEKQKCFEDLEKNNYITESFEGLPDFTEFRSIAEKYMQEGSLFVFDDLPLKNSNFAIQDLFTKYSHHFNASCVIVTHNLFDKDIRTISLNSDNIVLTNSPRSRTQFSILSRQVFPEESNLLPKALNHATKFNSFGYILLNLTPERAESLRILSNVFDHNKFLKIYRSASTMEKFRCLVAVPEAVFNKYIESEKKCVSVERGEEPIVQTPNATSSSSSSTTVLQPATVLSTDRTADAISQPLKPLLNVEPSQSVQSQKNVHGVNSPGNITDSSKSVFTMPQTTGDISSISSWNTIPTASDTIYSDDSDVSHQMSDSPAKSVTIPESMSVGSDNSAITSDMSITPQQISDTSVQTPQITDNARIPIQGPSQLGIDTARGPLPIQGTFQRGTEIVKKAPGEAELMVPIRAEFDRRGTADERRLVRVRRAESPPLLPSWLWQNPPSISSTADRQNKPRKRKRRMDRISEGQRKKLKYTKEIAPYNEFWQ